MELTSPVQAPVVSPLADVPAFQPGLSPQAGEKVAADFESVFLSVLLKEMRKTLEDSSLFPGDKSDIFGSMFDTFMAQHMARQGSSIGIADMVKSYLETEQAATPPLSPTTELRKAS